MSMRSLYLTLFVIVSMLPFSTSFAQTSPLKIAQKNYASFELAYPYYKALLNKLEVRKKLVLNNRGEAHITLITPPEYAILLTKIPRETLERLIDEFLKTTPRFEHICLGTVSLKTAVKSSQTYFVVISSPELFKFRKSIATLSGLKPKQFDPEAFYPHITLGFTNSDLHLEDGVIKDAKTCSTDLQFVLRER